MPLPHMHDRSTEALRIRSEASYISRLNGYPDQISNGEEQEYRGANGRGVGRHPPSHADREARAVKTLLHARLTCLRTKSQRTPKNRDWAISEKRCWNKEIVATNCLRHNRHCSRSGALARP
jgi:hypothetical protein